MRKLLVLILLLVCFSADAANIDYRALLTNFFTTNNFYVGINTNTNGTLFSFVTNLTSGGAAQLWVTNPVDGSISNVNWNTGVGIFVQGNSTISNPSPVTLLSILNSNNSFLALKASGSTNVQQAVVSYSDIIGTRYELENDGDLKTIRSIGYHWPLTNGTSGQALITDGNTPQQLSWAGTVSSNNFTNMVSFFVNGHTNQLAKFTPNTNTVGDSTAFESATNQVEWRSKLFKTVAWTNQFTNTIYGRDDGTGGSWDRLSIISASGLGSGFNEILGETTLSGANGNAPLLLHNAWQINHGTVTSSGNTAGYLLPKQDNAFNIGIASLRVKQVTAGPLGFSASDSAADTPVGANFHAGTYSIGQTANGIDFFVNATGFIGWCRNVPGVGHGFGMNNGGWYGAGHGNLVEDTYFMGGNEAKTWMFNTNNTTSTANVNSLEGGEGSGTDKVGDDILILGGRSTGVGRAGAVRIQTVQPAASTSSALNVSTNERAYFSSKVTTLTTNAATGIFTITLPTTLKHLSILVYATSTIDNGTDIAMKSETFLISVLNKAATVTTHVSSPAQQDSLATGSAGISSTTWTATVASQTVTVNVNVVTTGISATTSTCDWQVHINTNDRCVITPL